MTLEDFISKNTDLTNEEIVYKINRIKESKEVISLTLAKSCVDKLNDFKMYSELLKNEKIIFNTAFNDAKRKGIIPSPETPFVAPYSVEFALFLENAVSYILESTHLDFDGYDVTTYVLEQEMDDTNHQH